MTKIFISYRREDTGFGADRVFDDALDYVEDRADVFMDIDGIPPGADFVDFISQKVAQCDVLFALIGRDWLDMRDAETGQRRLDDPDDFVRIEIASALARNIPVVPILMGEAPMPRAQDLPDDLKPLARRNARRVGRASFKNDMAELMKGLGIASKAKKEDSPQPVEQESPDQRLFTFGTIEPYRPPFDPGRYVFISHPNSIDPEIVRILARGLIDAGMPVWIFNPSDMEFEPEELVSMSWQKSGGNHFEQALDAVRRASCVVMLTGRTTGAGGFQTKELEAAIASNKEIVAAIVDDLPFDELPKGLEDRFVPPIDAERLRSGGALPILITDILSAADTPPKPRRKSHTALWAALGLGVLAATGLGVAWAAGVFAPTPEAEVGRAEARYPTVETSTDRGSSRARGGDAAYNQGDYASASRLYEADCRAGEMHGCHKLGTLNEIGLGVPQDYTRAHSLYQKACEGGNMSGCYNLGRLYYNAFGVAQDYARARSLYQQACDGGNDVACGNLQRLPN